MDHLDEALMRQTQLLRVQESEQAARALRDAAIAKALRYGATERDVGGALSLSRSTVHGISVRLLGREKRTNRSRYR